MTTISERIVVDAGERQYELVRGWGQLPSGWLWGQVGAVAVDSRDNDAACLRQLVHSRSRRAGS